MFIIKKNGRPPVDKCRLICPICNKEFFVHPYRIRLTKVICCSKKCSYKNFQNTHKITRQCIECGNNFSFKKAEEKKRPKIYCSHACMYKGKITTEITFYRQKAFDNFPNCCYFCNKTNQKLEIHHIDYDRSNNDISNLVILCISCHRKIHLLFSHIKDRLNPAFSS